MDPFREIEAARRRVADRAERLAQATAELAERRITCEVNNGDVKATVDGNGMLLVIELAKGCVLPKHQSYLLGARITEAVNTARGKAALDSRALLASVLGNEQSADVFIGVTEPSPARRRPATDAENTDEYFERLNSDGILG